MTLATTVWKAVNCYQAKDEIVCIIVLMLWIMISYYFKFGYLMKKDNASWNNHRHISQYTPLDWNKYGLDRTEKKPFFSKQKYLDAHSKEIAKIIYENWTKEAGIFTPLLAFIPIVIQYCCHYYFLPGAVNPRWRLLALWGLLL